MEPLVLLKRHSTHMEDETTGAVEPTTDETTEEEIVLDMGDEEDVDALKAAKAKSDELAKNYKIRAEKAEKDAKDAKANKPQAENTLSTADFYALMQANVPEEDVAEVTDYAAFKKISVAEALKASTVKTLLAERKEGRAVAEATNTGTTRRQTAHATPDKLLENASKGNLPDTDEGLSRLAEARLERRREAQKRT